MKRSLILLIVFVLTGCHARHESTSIQSDTTAVTAGDSARVAQSGYADVNGIKMYYELYGAGSPIVLIHGGGSTIQSSFGRIIPELAKKHLVIGVELQAHGRTSDRNTPISFEQDADDVAALLDKLNISKADVLGFSNGGNTTMQLALRHPEKVDRIIVASAFYKRDGMFPGFWDMMKKGTIDDMPTSLKQEFLRVTPDSSKLQNLFEKSSQRMLNFKDWDDDQLKGIKAKTLLVNSDKDVATSEHIVAMSKLIPECQLLIIPGGHGEYMGEFSFSDRYVGAFVTLVEEFLKD